MKYITSMKDSLVNLVSGLGTAKDKATANQYGFVQLSPEQLESAYRGDWIAAKAVDIPAEDATREWRSWQADKEQISALEELETHLGIQSKTKEAMIAGRLYGGGLLVFYVEGTGEWDEELIPERVKQGALKYVHAVSRYEISAGEIERDLLSKWYGEPQYYMVTSTSVGAVKVHPSRVVKFQGKKLPRRDLSPDGFGDSIIQAIDDAVKNAASAQGSIATLMQESNIDVIKIPDFMESLATAEYRQRIITRFALANTGKSINRALMLDKNEEWNKIANNFSGLPDLLRIYLNIAAGACDVPATRFLGQSPGGLNATGDSDIRNYYDNVAGKQKNEIKPALSLFDECLIRSALGERPEEIYYTWKPLWQMTDSEKADSALKKSQVIMNLANSMVLPQEVLSAGAMNMLIEDGTLPGLEAAVKEYESAGEGDLDEGDEEVSGQFVSRTEAQQQAAVQPGETEE